MSKIIIWGRRTSFNVQKVMWAMDELCPIYEHRNAGGDFGGLDSAEFLEMNPHGLVPVLQDGEEVVWESNSIVRYLSAKYGQGTLWLDNPFDRSLADRWIDWSATALQPSFMKLFWGYYRTPESARNHSENIAALAACQKHFRALDAHLAKNAYLAGASFTAADIPAGTTLHRYFSMGLDVERPENVMRWFALLNERPAFLNNIVVPFSELYGRLAF
jgi:glutathione S-transferase